jgi:hypothetical protein
MSAPLHVTFTAGLVGAWRIDRIDTLAGQALALADRLAVREAPADAVSDGPQALWCLRGVVSNTRYTRRTELDSLGARQEGLNRAQARRAALIPMGKSPAWWALAQDERRAIFEEQSHHIGIGLDYLPAVARRLHHSRELGEPFDFLTWFEYAPAHEAEFEELLRRLRGSPEWAFVDREVDVRLIRE